MASQWTIQAIGLGSRVDRSTFHCSLSLTDRTVLYFRHYFDTRARAHTDTYAPTHTPTPKHTHSRTHTHTHTHTDTLTHTHRHTHIQIDTLTHTHRQTHTHTHTATHTHTYTCNTHTQTYRDNRCTYEYARRHHTRIHTNTLTFPSDNEPHEFLKQLLFTSGGVGWGGGWGPKNKTKQTETSDHLPRESLTAACVRVSHYQFCWQSSTKP